MSNKKFRLLYLIPFLSAFLIFSSYRYYDGNYEINATDVINHIKYLASDELGGRFPGTKGDSLAEEYAIHQFESYGIPPGGDDGYREKFDFVSEIKLGKKNFLSVANDGEPNEYTIGIDYYPLSFSSVGEAAGELVFTGYGISAPDLKYDDLKDIDLKGKIAVVMRYSPGENNPHDNPFSKYDIARMKCTALKEAGAIGVIFFMGPQNGEDELMKHLSVSTTNDNIGIPVINVKRNIIEKLFKSNGKDLAAVQKQIDSTRTPDSFILMGTKIRMKTDLQYVRAYTANIIGYLEGNDPILKNEVIVIGAHMDHLGDGMKYGSLSETGKPAIHNGADDNASGDAGVFELAEKLASERTNLKRSYLFMLFNGEEAGLIGSSYFTKSPLFKKYDIITMINMDMIGRLRDDKLEIGGAGTSSIWKRILDSLNTLKENFKISFKDEGYGPSDHSSFYSMDIPVLFFFTGLHEDYHRPSDKWTKINSEGEVKVLDLISDLINVLDDRTAKPDFIKTVQEKEKTMRGFRVTLGIVPDYASDADGLQILGVKPGGPAATAGLQKGDVIIKFGTHEVKNIYDYTYALSEFKPGDESEVVVKRGDETLTFKVLMTGK
jgi:aminopeptidase YwaD